MEMRCMNERELELNEIKERDEKNKVFHKRLHRFYVGLIIPIVLAILVLCVMSRNVVWIWVMGGIGVVWVAWLIYGIFSIKCPHCGAHLNRADPFNIRLCPYCGTILKVYSDMEK